MRILLITIITFFAFSTTSIANTLTMGDGLRLLAVDGQVRVKNNTLPITIESGKRQLVISYEKNISQGNFGISGSYNRDSSRKIVTSSPYIFFVDISQDTKISVQRFTSYVQARSAIRRGLVFHIENTQTTDIIENADQLKGNGVNPFSPSNIKPLIESYNEQNDIRFE